MDMSFKKYGALVLFSCLFCVILIEGAIADKIDCRANVFARRCRGVASKRDVPSAFEDVVGLLASKLSREFSERNRDEYEDSISGLPAYAT